MKYGRKSTPINRSQRRQQGATAVSSNMDSSKHSPVEGARVGNTTVGAGVGSAEVPVTKCAPGFSSHADRQRESDISFSVQQAQWMHISSRIGQIHGNSLSLFLREMDQSGSHRSGLQPPTPDTVFTWGRSTRREKNKGSCWSRGRSCRVIQNQKSTSSILVKIKSTGTLFGSCQCRGETASDTTHGNSAICFESNR